MSGQFFTSFDGAKIHYNKTCRDKNKWLIFLHGFGGDLTAWAKERAYFDSLNVSTIAMDLRGHGLSERSSDKNFYKLENFAKDVVTLLEKEKISNIVIIGHCFGGMVSIYLQAKFPAYSRGLVLVDTSYKPPFFSYNPVERIFLKEMFRLLEEFMPNLELKSPRNFDAFINTNDLNIKRLMSDMLHTSLQSYMAICKNLVDLNIKTLLDKINVPTLIIEGLEDSIFPPAIAKYLHKRIKKSQLELIPGANHILVLNNPKDLEDSINSFLKKINFT